jgi:putative acetyltransferase
MLPGRSYGKCRLLELDVIIRDETESDIEVIAEVTKKAFETCPHGEHTEQFIIKALRAGGALVVSLVAEISGKVAGHVAFSPVTVSDGSPDWYGLGPVSVLPKHQKQGIGTALINEGLSRLKARGGKGCVLVGEPEYYRRFGFRNLPALTLDGVPQQYFLALPFGQETPRGVVVFHSGFLARS